MAGSLREPPGGIAAPPPDLVRPAAAGQLLGMNTRTDYIEVYE